MAPPIKHHVKRIYKIATNQDTGEQGIFTDYFVDVLRIDQMPVQFQSSEHGRKTQIITYQFIWNDDPNNPVDGVDASNADLIFENANAARKTERRKIADPDVKSSGSTSSIDDNDIYLWIVDRLKVRLAGADVTSQVIQFVFNDLPRDGSKGTPAKRTTTVLKIANNDLGGMKMADSNDKPFPVDWDIYKAALLRGKTDPTDKLFLTVEVTDKFNVVSSADIATAKRGQNIVHVVTENSVDAGGVESLFPAGDPNAKDANGDSALIRLDPLQTIVNVGSNIIAVEFLPEDS